jgi:sulfur carrier protein
VSRPDPTAPIEVEVNGERRQLAPGATVADLVALVADSPRGLAVAVNADVVPRSTWPAAALHEGDRIELLSAAQGG